MMRFRQNLTLTLSFLIMVGYFFYSGYTTHQHQPSSDQIEIHVAPDYSNEDVIKPASGLSAFFNIVQIAGSIKQLLHDELFRACINSKHVAHLHGEIPIFLSYRVIRI